MTIDEKVLKSGIFMRCELCDKKLIKRLSNGLLYFAYGGLKGETKEPRVELLIHGSIKMKCIRKTCEHWNTINYLPTPTNTSNSKSRVSNPDDGNRSSGIDADFDSKGGED